MTTCITAPTAPAEPGWVFLRPGDMLQPGDQAWTWNTPDCVSIGWVEMEPPYEAVVWGMVPLRRRQQ